MGDDDIAPARRSVSGRSRISRAERAVVPHFAHSKYTDMFTIIVRTNKVKDLNEDFITKELCKGEADNYFIPDSEPRVSREVHSFKNNLERSERVFRNVMKVALILASATSSAFPTEIVRPRVR